ncbi:DUF6603 domain-containing protein [Streptomyces sp. NPDC093225]|uniref:DUF6603 domain-containing protein n=1 Tax=Streptomyces sp. NPDC093225 TaxID=3366034 RepID=UPI003828F2A7
MGSVAELAAELRAGLSGIAATLGGLDAAGRRQAVREALGVLPPSDLTAGGLLGRLGASVGEPGGELWLRVVDVLTGAADRSSPLWDLEVPGLFTADAGGVQAAVGAALGAEFTVVLRIGELGLTEGLRLPRGGTLTLTVPADPAAAVLELAAGPLHLALPDADGLLGLFAPGGPVLVGDLVARVDGQGVRFEGGTGRVVALPLRSASGGLRAPSMYLAATDGALSFTSSFGASIPGLADASVDGVGIAVATDGDGRALPATAIALSLAIGPARGSGFLAGADGEYRGALALGLGPVDVRAFAVLRTRQGALLVALSAEFTPPIELGLALTLNAVGGIVGIGHAVDRAGLAAAVQSGHLDRVLFPDEPAAAAAQILGTLATVFVTRRGSVVVGPMLRLGWGRPVSFVTADIGVIIEPTRGTTSLLGRLRVALPAPQAPVIELKASVGGVVDADGTVQFAADLTGSRMLTAGIEGGLAVRITAGPGPAFLLSAGGWHPAYPAPAGFPTPRRLALTLADSPFLRISFTGYLALTPGTVQAGAALAVVVGTRSTGVTGHLHFDALVRWEPSFGVVLDLGGAFALRFAGRSICTVQLRVRVEGPTPCWHIAGRASVSLFWVDIDFPFDEHWACSRQITATPAPDVAQRLERELDEARNWAPLLPRGTGALVTLLADGKDGGRLLHPLGRVRFSQRLVPLGIPISRFGAGRLPAPQSFDVTVRYAVPGGNAADAGASTPVTEHFARADFFELTDDERLTQPPFERLRSGIELTPSAPPPAARRYEAEVRYESKWLGSPGDGHRKLPRWAADAAYLARTVPYGAVATGGAHTARTRYAADARCPSALRERAFTVVDADTLTPRPGYPSGVTFTEAAEALRSVAGTAAGLRVVPVHEVRP